MSLSKEFSFPVLARRLVKFKDAAALQIALSSLDFDLLSGLATAVEIMEPVYKEEVRKINQQMKKEQPTKKEDVFDKIIAEISRIYVLTETLNESGTLIERSNQVTLNMTMFNNMIEGIKHLEVGDENYQQYLSTLSHFETNFNALPLLAVYFRGYYYKELKDKNDFTFEELAERLGLSKANIHHSIQFYGLINEYPLLLKAKTCYRDIVNNLRKIRQYFEKHEEIKSRFIKKIHQVTIIMYDPKSKKDITFTFPLCL